MIVEIWSDVACPFCYLGKRRFENALAQFAYRDEVEVVWRSFQLNPSLRTDPAVRIDQYLSREKGIDLHSAKRMNERVAQMGRQDGLVYDFDRVIVANTFDAHRFIHFAKAQGSQNEAEERLFRAYFTEARNVDDRSTLVELGREIGLDPDALAAALANGSYAGEVRADIVEARRLGVHGVPFFVFDRKYAVSGAQESGVFAQALEHAFAEWRKERPTREPEAAQGPACTADGTCT